MHVPMTKYLLALLGVAAAALIRWAVDPIFGTTSPYITFYAAIMITAVLAGCGPGLVATFSGGIIGYVFFLRAHETHFLPSLAESIRVAMYLGFGTFISFIAGRLRNSERRARESEERLSLAQSVARAGIWDHDLRRRKNIWSEEYYRIYGLNLGSVEPSYKNWILCVHPEDRDYVDRKGREFFRGKGGMDIEFRIQRPDRQVRWVKETGKVILDHAGKAYRFIGITIDITERKAMEEALQKSRDELELRVKERTAKLHESESRLRVLAGELINAQEKERNRIAQELHDSLAAQLAAIKYKLERKLDGGESSQHRLSLAEIIQDVQNANLETRRIMANLRPSILDDLGILPALSWLSRETEKSFPETSVRFIGSVPEQEVPDALKIVLFRVVQESLANAIRHGKSSTIRIALERKQSWLRLAVEDNGKGFESAARKESSGGMGLVSMQQRVESAGGIFSISSKPGEGTIVRAEWNIGGTLRASP